jgi:hypothetical protein
LEKEILAEKNLLCKGDFPIKKFLMRIIDTIEPKISKPDKHFAPMSGIILF